MCVGSNKGISIRELRIGIYFSGIGAHALCQKQRRGGANSARAVALHGP